MNAKIPEDGFEPPLKDPESSVLPLDDSGTKLRIYNIINFQNGTGKI